MIPDCCMQENKPHKPRKISIWPSKACLEATTGQDFDLDQVQRTEGLAGFCRLPKLFVPMLRALPAPEVEWHQQQHLLSRSKNCQVSALHRKVTYSKRQTQYQRSSLVMQMTAGENLLTANSLIPGSNMGRGGNKHLNTTSLRPVLNPAEPRRSTRPCLFSWGHFLQSAALTTLLENNATGKRAVS